MQTVPIAILGIIVVVIAIFFLIGIEEFYKNSETDIQKKMLIKNNNYLMSEDEFFKKVEKNQVFLIGSSHMAKVNATEVQNFSNSSNVIYNIGITGDTPFSRINQIDKIIESKPKVILYGISYRDFQFPFNDYTINIEELNSTEKIYCEFKKVSEYFPENPHYQIKKLISLESINLKGKYVDSLNTPFFIYSFEDTSVSDINYIRRDDIRNWNSIDNTFCEINSIKEIISKAKDNGIEIILLTTPLHNITLQEFSKSQKENFEILKNYLIEKYDIKIYEFTTRYSSINNIWTDGDHIASDPKVEVFNRDLAKILDAEE